MKRLYVCAWIAVLGLPACTGQSPRDAAAERREEQMAISLEREADFWWQMDGTSGDWYTVEGKSHRLDPEGNPRFRKELLEWLGTQDLKRDLAVVTVTPSVSDNPGDPFAGQDAFGKNREDSIARIEAILRQQGFRRVVFIQSPHEGHDSIVRDSAARSD